MNEDQDPQPQQAAPVAVPDGWKPVPVEATREMCAAAVMYANGSAVYKNVIGEVLAIEERIYGEVYEAMLAASPQAAPAPPQEAPAPQRKALTDEQLRSIECPPDPDTVDRAIWTDVRMELEAAGRDDLSQFVKNATKPNGRA